MDIFGILMIVVGLILMVASRGIYRNGLKSARKLTDSSKETEEYMMLVGSGMIAIKIIGFVVFIIGIGIFIAALYLR